MKTVSVQLDDATYDDLRVIAFGMDLSKAKYVRRLLKIVLANAESQAIIQKVRWAANAREDYPV